MANGRAFRRADRRTHVPKTLLAVDDSATMRKVLEISFAGEDYRVVAADGSNGALSRLGDEPSVAVIDTSLGADDGYALAKEVRTRLPRTAIVVLASRYAPYDPSRGRDAGVDDYIDKPFDTQALIDKVKRAVIARETLKAVPAPAPAPAPVHAPPPAAAPVIAPAFSSTARSPIVSPHAPPKPTFGTQRAHTLSFEGSPVAPPAAVVPPVSRTAPSGVQAVQPSAPIQPPQAPVQPPAPTAAPVAQIPTAHTVPTAAPPRTAEAPAAPAANGQFASKLSDLGLTSSQVEAVLALSREVVERVVWEVVPQLAETIIKEEIVRLTKS
jgi:CheY-like chemotaxis protein